MFVFHHHVEFEVSQVLYFLPLLNSRSISQGSEGECFNHRDCPPDLIGEVVWQQTLIRRFMHFAEAT